MTQPFSTYAHSYDAMYSDKNYEAEAATHFAALTMAGLPQPKSLLDGGCGTGGHALVHAASGISVTGIDRAPAMLEIARAKAASLPPETPLPRFLLGEAASFRLETTFDAVAAYFAVVSYLTQEDQIIGFLRSARAHLRPGGSLYFDAWHGAAVLSEPPQVRVRDFQAGGRRFIRKAEPTLDRTRVTTTVRYNVLTIEDGKIVSEANEDHVMRGFFVNEITGLLTLTGFKAVFCSPTNRPGEALNEHDWTFAVLAVAV